MCLLKSGAELVASPLLVHEIDFLILETQDRHFTFLPPNVASVSSKSRSFLGCTLPSSCLCVSGDREFFVNEFVVVHFLFAVIAELTLPSQWQRCPYTLLSLLAWMRRLHIVATLVTSRTNVNSSSSRESLLIPGELGCRYV